MMAAVLWDRLFYWHLKLVTESQSLMENPLALLMNHRLFISLILLFCWPLFGYECIARTREPSQEGASLSEWACLSHWHQCQKLLGSHPSWDKWSFGLRECSTVPSFDVSAVKDCRVGLSRVLHLHELQTFVDPDDFCVVIFSLYICVGIIFGYSWKNYI